MVCLCKILLPVAIVAFIALMIYMVSDLGEWDWKAIWRNIKNFLGGVLLVIATPIVLTILFAAGLIAIVIGLGGGLLVLVSAVGAASIEIVYFFFKDLFRKK